MGGQGRGTARETGGTFFRGQRKLLPRERVGNYQRFSSPSSSCFAFLGRRCLRWVRPSLAVGNNLRNSGNSCTRRHQGGFLPIRPPTTSTRFPRRKRGISGGLERPRVRRGNRVDVVGGRIGKNPPWCRRVGTTVLREHLKVFVADHEGATDGKRRLRRPNSTKQLEEGEK